MEIKPITIAGCGPGALEYVTPAALHAIEQAEVLVGARRLLETFPRVAAERIVVGADVHKALDAMAKHVGRRRIVVLVTGDPGLCSLARPVIRGFGRDACRAGWKPCKCRLGGSACGGTDRNPRALHL